MRAQNVWGAIEPLTHDPYPTSAEEAGYLKSENADPAFLAINSTRGEALSDVIRYALWVHNKMHADGKTKEESGHGLAQMPEVRQVLEDHLDPKVDPSLAIRSVYGRWIPWLQLIDRGWVQKNLPAMFPAAEEQRELCDAAWTSYVVHCDAYNDVFDGLKSEYHRQIDQIGKHSFFRSHLGHPDERLAAHLMILYWRGKLSLSDTLLEYFYKKASGSLRAYAIAFLGRGLRDTSGEIAPVIIDRLKALWTSRLKAAHSEQTGASYVEELAQFGWWFASKRFDNEWALFQLAEALRLANKVEPDHLVVEKLAEMSPTVPLQSVRCLAMIVQGDKEGWGILGWRDFARKILIDAMNSAEQAAKDEAIQLIHRLGSRGYFEFGELLSGSPH